MARSKSAKAGDVTITHDGDKTASALKNGAAIDENDVIMTTDHSRVKVEFADKTELVIANKGSFTINNYIYDPANPAKNKARFSILKAAFYYVGGLIDKGAKPDVEINLDLGTIGIRGTKLMRAMRNGECWIYLEEGKITVSNKGGAVTLASGEGTITVKGKKRSAPQAPHAWSDEVGEERAGSSAMRYLTASKANAGARSSHLPWSAPFERVSRRSAK